MDEARFGTHSKLGHGWFPTGKRTRINVRLSFKNFYIYGAVEPKTGETFNLILPKVNTEMMNLFLQELSSHYTDQDITLVMDGAGWHKSKKLDLPTNITIVYLPPYCPELNPVERFWLYVKGNIIRNKCYDSLDSLEEAACTFIGAIANNTVAQICAFDWTN